jgi:hypothetical protein
VLHFLLYWFKVKITFGDHMEGKRQVQHTLVLIPNLFPTTKDPANSAFKKIIAFVKIDFCQPHNLKESKAGYRSSNINFP